MNWHFLLNLFTIVAVNLALSGDNGVTIALVVRTLPQNLRVRAMTGGAICATLLLVVATFYAAPLLHTQLLQSIGGMFVLWIAVKLFRDSVCADVPEAQLSSFSKAIWLITVADVTMSSENIVAIAAIAQSDILLVVFGLGLSIPVVVFASGFLATLMDKYPVVVYLGAAFLGRIGGQMIVTDSFTVDIFHPTGFMRYCAEAAAAMGVLVAGRFFQERRQPIRAL